MPTLVRDPQPVEFEALLERRRRLGQDLLDEVWEGAYHVIPVPAAQHADMAQQLAVILGPLATAAGLVPMIGIFNLGAPEDYRVPDGGLHRTRGTGLFATTAALVVEIVSPGDHTWKKLGFYAAHGVEELLIVDPGARSVDWLGLAAEGRYKPVDRSALIELSAAALKARIDWPD